MAVASNADARGEPVGTGIRRPWRQEEKNPRKAGSLQHGA
jgi:hypothetical protein